MTTHRLSLLLAVAAILLAGLVSYAVCRCWFPFRAVVKPLEMNATWITASGAPAYEASFRQTITLPGEVRNAWIAVAGADSFELSVNGRTLGSQPLARATLPFQKSLSEPGQQIDAGAPMLQRHRPREYQWSGFRSWRLPIFIDLTRQLVPGRNVVCISVASRTAPVRLCAEGEILLRSGERRPIRSDRDWKAAAIPARMAGLVWTQTNYPDDEWSAAAQVAPPSGEMIRTIEPGMFREPFAGHWLRPSTAAQDRPVVFETTWRLEGPPEEAWLRLVANRGYDLTINGRAVLPPPFGPGKPRDGAWLLDSPAPLAGPSRAEVLDPEDVDSIFEEETTEDSGATNEVGSAALPPLALTRNQQVGAFDLYSVPWLLKRGENRITVRLNPTKEALNWNPQFALDAKAIQTNGSVRRLSSGPGWRCHSELPEGLGSANSDAAIAGLADTADAPLPRKIYAGLAWNAGDKFRCWLVTTLAVYFIVLGAVVFARKRWPHSRTALTTTVIVPTIILASAVLVESSWVEREETLLFLSGRLWGALLGGAALAAVVAAATQAFPLMLRGRLLARTPVADLLPRFALCWILILCAFLRAKDLHFQPPDPDEYASMQAIVSVARTGTPQLFDTVYYTRSPLYHYLVGGVVKLFGENIWAMRLPSVFFAVATTALLYLFGARLLRSRWTGLVAAALYTIHPFAAMSGYLVRFYQQQQFFALLTVFFFCRGFVFGQSMKHRYYMLAAFFATVLSQELSLTIGFSLLVGYLLFAERKSWSSEIRFAVAVGCVLTLVFLDLVVFQTRCITRVDGTSPSLEPSLTLNLESPSNLLMMFMVFSRLHLALSLLLLLSLPLVLRQRNRAALALHTILFSGIVFTAIFVTGSGFRYQYWLIPLWLVLGVHGVRLLVAFLADPARLRLPRPVLQQALGAILITAILLTWSPWRLTDSFATKIQTDSTSALSFVRRHARTGDAIMVSAPHTQSALLEIGRIDYDLAIPLLHDFFYRKDGRLIDRNAGAEAIRNLDMLQQKCAEHDRLWVLVNRDDILRSPGKDIRWRLPGGRTDLFLRSNLQLTHRSYSWDVFLWDAATGHFRNFRRNR